LVNLKRSEKISMAPAKLELGDAGVGVLGVLGKLGEGSTPKETSMLDEANMNDLL
jgi:hypothetical protein